MPLDPSSTKCAHIDCAREAQKRFAGRSRPGRLPVDAGGIGYCAAHYEQLRRGEQLRDLRPRKTGTSPYRQGVLDAATIAEFHGYKALAELLRKLK